MSLPQRGTDVEDEILSGSAAARIVTWYASYGSGRNARKQHSALADVQVRGPRGRGAAFERCLHDRPRPKPMRRANVSLWKSRLARARQDDDAPTEIFQAVTRISCAALKHQTSSPSARSL